MSLFSSAEARWRSRLECVSLELISLFKIKHTGFPAPIVKKAGKGGEIQGDLLRFVSYPKAAVSCINVVPLNPSVLSRSSVIFLYSLNQIRFHFFFSLQLV
jgi:hypothetical protein